MRKKIITKFIEKNACKPKQEIIKKLIKRFNLNKEEAEELYQTWKKEYMKFKG